MYLKLPFGTRTPVHLCPYSSYWWFVCEKIRNPETTIRKRRLLFVGAVQRTHNERLTRRMMFGTMAGGENPGPGRPEKNWAQCLVDDLRWFRATEGCTESVPLLFGVETVLWPTAAKKGWKWYRGVAEAAEGFMTRWHRNRDEAESSWLRRGTCLLYTSPSPRD